MQAGLDSLGAVELRNAVGAAFDIQLSATATFDYPTLTSLAAHIAQHAAEEAGGKPADNGLNVLLGPGAIHNAAAGLTALMAASARYPAPGTNNVGSAMPARADLPPASLTSGLGNADLAGFYNAIEIGADIPSVVPPQRWDVDSHYHPGGEATRSSGFLPCLGCHAFCLRPRTTPYATRP